jgi:beta-galactosidase
LGARSGFKDESNRVREGGIAELTGARVAEWDSPAPEVWNAVAFDDGPQADVSRWMELLEPAEGTEVVARYTDDFYRDVPAIVRRQVGQGQVWYVGTLGEGPHLAEAVIRRVLAAAHVPLWELPEGVEAVTRGAVTFLLNHGEEAARVTLPSGGSIELSPYGVEVVAPAG